MDSSINELELLRYLAPTYFVWEKGDDFPEWIDDLISWGIVEQCDGKLKTYDGEHSYEAHPGDVIVRSADGAWVVSKERVPRTALARSALGWRDIESAPKDGTPIIVWCPEFWVNEGITPWGRGAIVTAYWGVYVDCREDEKPCWIVVESNGTDPCTPTMWMPLPAPPASNSGEG